jgi:uncharacterized membrane protein YhiD involved in acid resistance
VLIVIPNNISKLKLLFMIDLSSLTNNLEGSSLINVIIIALVAFVLSALIALTYQKTLREMEVPRYYIQSLILISVPVAMVMQAIGDSLARGLGMLGALAIIRFRTTLRNPRNMVFMFVSIAVGIATGVYGITIAIIGTLSFCLIAIAIHFSPLSKENSIIANLQFSVPNKNLLNQSGISIENILKQYCKKTTLLKYDVNTRKKEEHTFEKINYNYKIRVNSKEKATDLADKLSSMESVRNVKLNFRDEYEKI